MAGCFHLRRHTSVSVILTDHFFRKYRNPDYWRIVTCLFLSLLAPSLAASEKRPPETVWKPLRIGAGGFITGLDIVKDGLLVVRTDTYGGYRWDEPSGVWEPLIKASNMPRPFYHDRYSGGIFEVAISPSDSLIVYMAYAGFVFRSDDGARSWSKTAFGPVPMDANESQRFGRRMAVAPMDPDYLLVGTQKSGMWRTQDGGKSFTKVASIPDSKALPNGHFPGVMGITFNQWSSATGSLHSQVVASSFGHGAFLSNDGGATWAPSPGPALAIRHACVAIDGRLYASDWGSQTSPERNSVWRLVANNWTRLKAPSGANGAHTVACDPFDANRVVVGTEGGDLVQSLDGGDTWRTGILWGKTRSAPDTPWLAWTNESYMTNGAMRFHPSQRNVLLFAEGIGFWTTHLRPDATSVVWNARTKGIEQLVTIKLLSPPGGSLVGSFMDRPIFVLDQPDTFPRTHGPDRDEAIQMGWDVDYSLNDPNHLVALINWRTEKSGFSRDGGATWTKFTTAPPCRADCKIGGSIAVSHPTNIVWAQSNNGGVYYTKDNGTTWRPSHMPGAPLQGESGWGWSHYLNRHILAADKATPGVFYAYNYLEGLYRSSDGGETWVLVRPGEIGRWTGYNATLRATPGQPGHLFFTAGRQTRDTPGDQPLWRSKDGGATWEALPVREAYNFGFGAPAVSGEYPTIFTAGYIGGAWGVWMSTDEGATWARMADRPHDSTDTITTIEGDMNMFGRVYVGFGGSGVVYGQVRGNRTDN